MQEYTPLVIRENCDQSGFQKTHEVTISFTLAIDNLRLIDDYDLSIFDANSRSLYRPEYIHVEHKLLGLLQKTDIILYGKNFGIVFKNNKEYFFRPQIFNNYLLIKWDEQYWIRVDMDFMSAFINKNTTPQVDEQYTIKIYNSMKRCQFSAVSRRPKTLDMQSETRLYTTAVENPKEFLKKLKQKIFLARKSMKTSALLPLRFEGLMSKYCGGEVGAELNDRLRDCLDVIRNFRVEVKLDKDLLNDFMRRQMNPLIITISRFNNFYSQINSKYDLTLRFNDHVKSVSLETLDEVNLPLVLLLNTHTSNELREIFSSKQFEFTIQSTTEDKTWTGHCSLEEMLACQKQIVPHEKRIRLKLNSAPSLQSLIITIEVGDNWLQTNEQNMITEPNDLYIRCIIRLKPNQIRERRYLKSCVMFSGKSENIRGVLIEDSNCVLIFLEVIQKKFDYLMKRVKELTISDYESRMLREKSECQLVENWMELKLHCDLKKLNINFLLDDTKETYRGLVFAKKFENNLRSIPKIVIPKAEDIKEINNAFLLYFSREAEKIPQRVKQRRIRDFSLPRNEFFLWTNESKFQQKEEWRKSWKNFEKRENELIFEKILIDPIYKYSSQKLNCFSKLERK